MSQEEVLSNVRQLILLKGEEDSIDKKIYSNNIVIDSLSKKADEYQVNDLEYSKLINEYSLTRIVAKKEKKTEPQRTTYCYCGVKILLEEKFYTKHYEACQDFTLLSQEELVNLIQSKYTPNAEVLASKYSKIKKLKSAKETINHAVEGIKKQLKEIAWFKFVAKKRLENHLEEKANESSDIDQQIKDTVKEVDQIKNRNQEDILTEALRLQKELINLYNKQEALSHLEKKVQDLKKENEHLEIEERKVIKRRNEVLVKIISSKENMSSLRALQQTVSPDSLEGKTISSIVGDSNQKIAQNATKNNR